MKYTITRIYLFICFIIILPNDILGATRYSISSGNWSTSGVWSASSGGPSCSCYPSGSDDAIIENGDIVSINGSSFSANSLAISNGAVNFPGAYSLSIGNGGVIIDATGDVTGIAFGILYSTGGITVSSTLSSTTVAVVLRTTAAQTISGTGTIPWLSIGSAVNATNNGTLSVSYRIAGLGTLTNGATGILNIGVNDANFTISTLNSNTSGNTVNYNRIGNQSIRAQAYHHLTISTAWTKTFSSGTTSIAGTLSIASANGDATTNSTTIQYNGSGAQSINNSLTYYNLEIAKTGGSIGTLAGSITVNNNLAITSGVLDASSYTINIKGGWTNTATFSSSTSTVNFNGTSVQSLTGATTFNNITINNTAGGSLSSDITIEGILTFTKGNITTGANVVIVSATGSVSRTLGHVNGNLRKTLTAGSPSATFQVGGGGNYTPASVTFTGITVSGTLTVSCTVGDHPSIGTSTLNSTKSVNRYWTLSNSGIVFTDYSAIFNFVSGNIDVGASTSIFEGERFASGTWNTETEGTRASLSTQLTSLTAFGDFQVAEPAFVGLFSIASGNWSTVGTWSTSSGGPSCGCIPSVSNDVTIENGNVITMDGNPGGANSLNISNGSATWTTSYSTNIGSGGVTISATGDISGNTAFGVLNTTGGLTLNSSLTSTTTTIVLITTAAQLISGTGSLYRLSIGSGVTATNNGEITINSRLAGSGTFANGATGTLTFNGDDGNFTITTLNASTTGNTVVYGRSGAQSVRGITYHNLTISGSGTKTLSGATILKGMLSVSAGTFDINGVAFTVQSDGSGTGQIAQISGTLSNATNVTVQRYIAGPDSGNRDLGVAISGLAVNDWADDVTITTPPHYWGSVQYYTEATNAWSELTLASAITEGRGYSMYIYDGDLPGTLDLTGTLVQGNVDVALTYGAGGGYNPVGNPYACDIDLEDADWSRPSVSTTYSVWDDAIYDYRYYTVGVGPGSPAGSRYIASGQGFWAQATAATTFGFREGVKAPAASATFYKTELNDALVLNLNGSNYATSTAMRFRNDATEAYDAELDASKRASPDKRAVAYLASLSRDGKLLASNCMPEIKGNTSIPLVAKAHREGVYAINLSNIPSSVPSYAKIMLEDLATGTMTEMKKNSTYSFTLDGNFDNNSPRFVLHIITDPSSPLKAITTESIQMFSYDNKAHLVFSFTEDTDVTVDIFNLMGQKTGATEHHRIKNQTIVMELPQNGNGIYLVTVTTPSGVISKKVQAVR